MSIGSPNLGAPGASLPQPLPVPSSPGTISLSPLPGAPSPIASLQDKQETDQLKAQLEQQKAQTEQLRMQLEQQRIQSDQLKAQVQSQQALVDAITKNNLVPANTPRSMTAVAADQSNNSIVTGMLWALGGVAVALGGGISLLGMFALFSRQQQRPPRTFEVFHADDYPINYLPARRRAQVLPPRRMVRRVVEEE